MEAPRRPGGAAGETRGAPPARGAAAGEEAPAVPAAEAPAAPAAPAGPAAPAAGEGAFRGTGGARSLSVVWTIVPGIVLAGVGGGIVFPILPLLGLRSGLSPAFIGVILAVNRATRIGADPLIGTWVDRVGARRMMLVGLLMEIVVMAVYAAAVPSGHPGLLFLVGRALWGPGAGFILISGQTMALHAATPENRGRVAGIIRTAQLSGSPTGLVIGGVVAGAAGDEAAFATGIAFAVAAAALAWRTVPDLRVSVPHTFRWRSVLATLAQPLVLAVSGLNLASFFAIQGLLSATLVLVVAARHIGVAGWPAQTVAGLSLAMFLMAAAVATPFVGRLADRSRRRGLLVAAGTVLLMAGFVQVAYARDAGRLGAGLVLVGLGMGCFNVPLLAVLGDSVAPGMRGSAVGGLQLAGDVGGIFGPILGTTALAAWGAAVPYLGTALLLAATLPLTAWLVRLEGRGADRPPLP